MNDTHNGIFLANSDGTATEYGNTNGSSSTEQFERSTTVFDAQGNIIQTYQNRVHATTFNADGTITETLTRAGELTPYSTKTTTFNPDGSITEVVS